MSTIIKVNNLTKDGQEHRHVRCPVAVRRIARTFEHGIDVVGRSERARCARDFSAQCFCLIHVSKGAGNGAAKSLLRQSLFGLAGALAAGLLSPLLALEELVLLELPDEVDAPLSPDEPESLFSLFSLELAR